MGQAVSATNESRPYSTLARKKVDAITLSILPSWPSKDPLVTAYTSDIAEIVLQVNLPN